MAKTSQAQIDSVKKYQSGRDAIMLRPSKDEGQQIRQAAADAGQSVQAYILQAVRDRMSAGIKRQDADGGADKV